MTRVLLVEDDVLLADCLRQWLRASGHDVVLATDAHQAIDELDGVLPHVIILDMLLPGANGVQVLHTLRSHADLAAIPVIICSSVVQTHTPALEVYGVKKVIDKTTLDRGVLSTAIEEVVS